MFARIKVVLVGALAALTMLGAAAPVLAQPETAAQAEAKVRWEGGVVTAVGVDGFTAQGPRGNARTVLVTAATQYFDAEAQPSSFADIQVGDRVRGALTVADDGTLTALLVFNAGPDTAYRGVGVVSTVDAAEQSLVFTGRRGRVWEFYVDAATLITDRAGETLGFGDIHAADRVFVQAELREDGKWWAVKVGLGANK